MIDRGSVMVTIGRRGMPASFRWHSELHRISDVQEVWRRIGAWWDGEGEKTFFRVLTDRGIYDLCFDHIRSEWAISAVHD